MDNRRILPTLFLFETIHIRYLVIQFSKREVIVNEKIGMAEGLENN